MSWQHGVKILAFGFLGFTFAPYLPLMLLMIMFGLVGTWSGKFLLNWMEENVAQCGYCQPGQIIKAYALLKSIPKPTEEEIKDWMDNLCRCGTYPRIINAIKKTGEEVGNN